jgi:hypothetical protein
LGLNAADSPLGRYLGAQSCASSSCHGGAGDKRDQFVLWNGRDVHRRAPATLTAARSTQIAKAAGIADATASARCTVCHAPFADVPAALRLKELDRLEGVSCETCHAPAERWLRSHTRPDVTATDRAADGLRPLEDLYVRANTCVACHEHLDRHLLTAGHPELRFELDGQSLAEPKHWQEPTGYNGAQAWLVGQLVALRELTWQNGKSDQQSEQLTARLAGLHWLLGKAGPAAGLAGAAEQADELAKAAAKLSWSVERTAAVLKALALSATDFRDAKVPREHQARRAERLVLALDRLLAASDRVLEQSVEAELNELFRLAQSLTDFDPEKFAASLGRFAAKLK